MAFPLLEGVGVQTHVPVKHFVAFAARLPGVIESEVGFAQELNPR